MGWGGARPNSGRKPLAGGKPRAQRARQAVAIQTDPTPLPPRPGIMRADHQARQASELSAQMMEAVTRASHELRAKERNPEMNPYRLPIFPEKAMPPKESNLRMAMDESLTWAGQQWAGTMLGEIANEGLMFLGYPYLSELAQRPEYRTMSETISTEMTRKWITLKGTGEADKTEKIRELNDYLDNLRVRDKYAELALHDGFFGRGHLFYDFGVDDEELKTPIGNGRDASSKAKIKKGSLKAIRTVEPVWVYPTTYNATNPLAHDWYNPQIWYVMGRQIHCSRLPTFVGREVPDLLKPAYSFGGLSMTQLAKPYVDIWLTTRESVGQLIHSFSVMVLMTDLQTILQPGNATQLMARVAMFNALRDNQGAFVLNKATEDFKNVSASLSGLHELQAQSQEHMMSVARIPAVKFTGIQPTGLNASSEGEMRAFYDTISAYQNKFFRPKLTQTIDIAMMSLWGEVDNDIVFDFNPLWELDEKEKGEKKAKEAETDVKYIDAGVISPEEVRVRLANDPESGYEGLDPDDVPEPPAQEGGPGGAPGGPGGAPPPGGPDDDTGGEEEAEEEASQGAGDGAILPFADEADPFAEDDADWKEGDHPRAKNGQFGSGGGGAAASKKKPERQKFQAPQYGMSPTPKTDHQSASGKKDEDGSEYFKKNWHKSGSVGGHSQPTAKQIKDYTDAWESQGKSETASSAKPLDPADLTKVGSQMGSNPGGVYQNKEGQKFYVKKGASAAHVRNELLAASLYQLAGAKTLNYVPVKGGGHVATEMQKLEKNNISKLSPDEIKKVQNDFAIHAWLSNWDAAGTGGDNQGVVNGEPTTLDVGGALEYRAQGGPKGSAFGDKVTEMQTMRDPKMSPDAARVFGKMTPDQIKASVERVAAIPDAAIRENVQKAGVSEAMADRLIARKRDLAKSVGVQAADAEFKEEDHPRAPDGKFGSGGGGGASKNTEKKAKEDAGEKKMDYGGLWTFHDDPKEEWHVNAQKIFDGDVKTGNFWRNMVRRLIKDGPKFGISPAYIESLKLNLGKSWASTAAKLEKAFNAESDHDKQVELNKLWVAAKKKAEQNGVKVELGPVQAPKEITMKNDADDLMAKIVPSGNNFMVKLYDKDSMEMVHSKVVHSMEDAKKIANEFLAGGAKAEPDINDPGDYQELYETLSPYDQTKLMMKYPQLHEAMVGINAEAEEMTAAEAAQEKPTPPKPPAPQASPADLQKAKKNTPAANVLNSPTDIGMKAISEFDKKYAGKTIDDPKELNQKVQDYKDLVATVNAQNAEFEKANAAKKAEMQAAAKAEAQKKAAAQKAAEVEAAKKNAEQNSAYMKQLGLSATEAEAFSGLASMLGHSQETAIASFKQYQKKAESLGYPITGFQAALIANYSNGGYGSINKALRSGSWTKAQDLYVKQVNKALKSMPTYTGMVTRNTSLGDEDLSIYKPGHIVQEHALTSTSTSSVFSGNVQYKIKAIGKRAAHIKKLSHHPGEDEVLFAAKTYFHVSNVEKKGGKTIIHMEEIEDHDY